MEDGSRDLARPPGREPEPARMPEPPAMPDPLTVRSSGAELCVYDFGGSGPPMLLAHATGFCAAVWAPVVERLRHDWHCVVPDMRAHGLSSALDGDLSWQRHAEDLLEVVEARGLRGAVGVGHSMGGATLLLAEQAAPGTFSKLWLWEPIVFPPIADPPGGNPLAEGALRRRSGFPSTRAAFDNFAGKPPLDELDPETLSAYVHFGFAPTADGGIELRCRPEDESETYRQGSRHHAWDHLGEIRCPVVVLRSEPTGAGADVVAPLVAGRIPGCRLEDHPELGHFGPLDDAERAAASIRALAEG